MHRRELAQPRAPVSSRSARSSTASTKPGWLTAQWLASPPPHGKASDDAVLARRPYEPRPALAGTPRSTSASSAAASAGCRAPGGSRARPAHPAARGPHRRDGASGRNGGFLLAGASAFHVDARERYGRAAARRLYAHTLAAQEEFFALAEELGAGEAVRRVGCLRLAASDEEAFHVLRHAEALREDGFPAELLEADDLPPVLRRSAASRA